jgi:hypothetical protein
MTTQEIILGPWESAAIGAVISLILALIFVPLLQDRVTDFLVETFGGWLNLRKADSLSGMWDQDWQVDGSTESVRHDDTTLTLKHLGKSIVGTFYFQDRTYKIRGRIENNTYISGIWFDECAGQVYHGALHARIEVNQKEISGKWVGFSRTHNRINTGTWRWRRRGP